MSTGGGEKLYITLRKSSSLGLIVKTKMMSFRRAGQGCGGNNASDHSPSTGQGFMRGAVPSRRPQLHGCGSLRHPSQLPEKELNAQGRDTGCFRSSHWHMVLPTLKSPSIRIMTSLIVNFPRFLTHDGLQLRGASHLACTTQNQS